MGLLHAFVEKYGELPTRREMREEFKVTEDPFMRVFGSWSSALDCCALERQSQKKHAEDTAVAVQAANPLLEELERNLQPHELKALVESTRINRPTIPPLMAGGRPVTGHFKALFGTDTHIGHKKFGEHWWNEMIEHGVKEGCDWMWHAGDILEGMSGRPGHVYELAQIGFEAQFDKAVSLMDQVPFPIRGITGNHDLWYAGKGDMGINVGQRLGAALPGKFIYLGDEEADEHVSGVNVKLWHGRDGASYATSYRTQKFIEGLSGGEKPHILLSGHAHKSIMHQCRNVIAIEGGTLCSQTGFMRGKKLAAHTGYWILEVWTNENGLARIKTEWCPFYER